jgi:uncharacterized membrane protein YraQ (UPF0718 family)
MALGVREEREGAATAAVPPGGDDSPGERGRLPMLVWSMAAIVVLSPTLLSGVFSSTALENWATVFLSLTLQAVPFLVLGIVVSASISAFLPAGWVARALDRRAVAAVPIAGLTGAVLPGCECSSVPVARRLVDKGAPEGAALAFLLAAPAINPVVMVSTAVAFPGQPRMVLARFVASFVVAVVVGLAWSRVAPAGWRPPRLLAGAGHHHGGRFVDSAASDLLQAGGFLVLGAALVATLHTAVPASVVDRWAGGGVRAVLVLALLAVVLSVCSEADAFVAAGLTQFSPTARLVFLVVGPMVDLKLIALHAGTFGTRFAARFDPLVLGCAITVGSVVGAVLL